jgi:NAD(P)-dependent dehydrogenase (short-subunit alcohol dehydrogenase family)
MITSIRGKVALITGASRGIGRAIACGLAEEGCRLSLIARGEAQLEETKEMSEDRGAEVATFTADVTDGSVIADVFGRTADAFGGIDIVVNNAGTGHLASIMEADGADWARTIDVNLRAAMESTRLAVPYLRKRGGGTIIFIASLSSKIAYGGGGAYCASKHGLLGFAGAVFEDVRGFGIRVCSICPGFVNTELIEGLGIAPKAIIQPDDVADAVRFAAKFGGTACPTEIVIRSQTPPYA